MLELPTARGIDLWRIDLAGALPPDVDDVLSADEMQRAKRFVFDLHRNRFARGRYALRKILADYLHLRARAVPLALATYGKPYLDVKDAFGFNLSHTDDLALLAVGAMPDIGVDVEMLHLPKDIRALAHSVFSPAENAAFATLADDALVTPFFNCWTQKEAVLKALGTGLSLAANSIHVGLDPTRKNIKSPLERSAPTISVVSLAQSADAIAALAVVGGFDQVRQIDYDAK